MQEPETMRHRAMDRHRVIAYQSQIRESGMDPAKGARKSGKKLGMSSNDLL